MKKTKQKKSRLGQYDAKSRREDLNISEPSRYAAFFRSVLIGLPATFLTLYRPRPSADCLTEIVDNSKRLTQPRPTLVRSIVKTICLALFGKPLAFLRHSFGTGSYHGRGFFDYCSTGLRLLFDKQSKASRSVPEGQSKLSRSSLEQVSKNSRTAPEAESKRGAGLLECEVPVSVGRQKAQFGSLFSPQPPKGGTGADDGKADCSVAEKEEALDFGMKCTSGIPLMYCECTVSVLRVYWKGTKKVLQRYYRGTRKVLRRYHRSTRDLRAVCTSGVHLLATKVGVRGNCSLINRVCIDYIKKWVPAICRRLSRRYPSRSFGTGNHDGNIKGQLLSKLRAYSLQLRAKIKPIAHGLQLTAMILLFSSVALAQSPEPSGAAAGVNGIKPLQIGDTLQDGHKAIPYANQIVIETTRKNPEFDLDRFPMEVYEIDEALIRPLVVGDSIPKELWDMPLQYVQKGDVLDKLYLKDFADKKLIVLDYWAQWCSPCIKSMDKWEGFVSEIGDDVAFLGVLVDYQHKALPVINERNWTSRSIIGLDAHVLVRFFFDRAIASRLVWIMDGRFIGVTGTSGYTVEQVKEMMGGGASTLVQAREFTYESTEGGSGK